MRAQAEVQVVVDDLVGFLKAAERLERHSRRISMQAPVTAMTLRCVSARPK